MKGNSGPRRHATSGEPRYSATKTHLGAIISVITPNLIIWLVFPSSSAESGRHERATREAEARRSGRHPAAGGRPDHRPWGADAGRRSRAGGGTGLRRPRHGGGHLARLQGRLDSTAPRLRHWKA